jgi:hypothetical protein
MPLKIWVSHVLKTVLLVTFLLTPLTANAYVGPGMGLGAIGVILGLFFSIILALLAILWYPFKRILKAIRQKHKSTNQ